MHSSAARNKGSSCPARAPGVPSSPRAKVPAGVTAHCTAISLRVSVPVLSVQITVTEPSASTAGSRRTMALRRAMLCTPSASVIVMIAGRPSGIAATARPTAARNMSAALYSRTSRPKAKVSPASPRMIRVSLRAKPAIWRRSGVSSVSTSASSVPTLPISVASPVATTMPLPSPLTTNVPACAIELRSPSGASAGTGATPLPTGTDSPVSAAS